MRPIFAPALAGIFACALAAGAMAQDSRPLNEAELKALYSENEMKGENKNGQKFTENYRADGTFRAESTDRSGGCCISDRGRWWVENGKLCKQYDNWRGGRKACTTVVRRADGYATSGGFKLNFKRQ